MKFKLPKDSRFFSIRVEGDTVFLTPPTGEIISPDLDNIPSRTTQEAIRIKEANPNHTIILAFSEEKVVIGKYDNAQSIVERYHKQSRQRKAAPLAPDAEVAAEIKEVDRKIRDERADEIRGQLIRQSRFKFTRNMEKITPSGGAYERRVRELIVAGLEWLDNNPQRNIKQEKDLEELGRIIDECTSSDLLEARDRVVHTIEKIADMGWEKYVAASEKLARTR